MKVQEAIKEVKIHISCADYKDDDYIDCVKKETMIVCKNALEKQIPKKPLYNGANWYKCPNECEIHKKPLGRDYFCPNCGQAIDWNTED